MDMTEVSGEDRQAPLGIFARSIPSQQRQRGESMSQVMQPRTASIRRTTQPNLAGESVEIVPRRVVYES
jgi:hypothetical protein